MENESARESERIRRLQARIDAALKETPAMRMASAFSDYNPAHVGKFDEALEAASGTGGGPDAVERVLDAFDRLARSGTADPLALRHDLMVFLARNPDAARLGLRLPSLGERSPWKTLPSKKP